MFPLPSQLPDRSKDYVVDIRGDLGPTSRFTAEEKGKGKAMNVITLEKTKKKEVNVMPVGKRTTNERDNRGIPRPSKNKGKAKEGDDAMTKKKGGQGHIYRYQSFYSGLGKPAIASKMIL